MKYYSSKILTIDQFHFANVIGFRSWWPVGNGLYIGDTEVEGGVTRSISRMDIICMDIGGYWLIDTRKWLRIIILVWVITGGRWWHILWVASHVGSLETTRLRDAWSKWIELLTLETIRFFTYTGSPTSHWLVNVLRGFGMRVAIHLRWKMNLAFFIHHSNL